MDEEQPKKEICKISIHTKKRTVDFYPSQKDAQWISIHAKKTHSGIISMQKRCIVDFYPYQKDVHWISIHAKKMNS